jgi:hypothetical protein
MINAISDQTTSITEVPTDSPDAQEEHWLNSKWRPAMGWMYFGVCIFDFVVAPILWSLLQAIYKGQVTSQWQPLTMQGAGLFHLSMGAIIGISAYGRTQEKMAGVNISSGFSGMGMSSMSSSSMMQSSVSPASSPLSTSTPISVPPSIPPER